ncbi:PKD domain-containing protein [Paraflavitalea sp. CAU 1676]|nr:PKD domain-containing protein [Paraflavitalea sp. CAU 1676]MDF2187531.1 PKD domain-containing protein [Paraflavitalea sp. CAU 1676]
MVVKFSDETTGNPNSWRWDLGNGTISFVQHPAATYFNPGTYTIKLVVSNGMKTDSIIKVQHITVYANPVAQFSASDTTGCFPLNVQFTDLSTAGDGIIEWREWDFGDGTVTNAANPEHRYTNAGNYTVSLHVRNSHGCTQTFTRTAYIRLNNGVKADYSYSVPNSCKPPTVVHFTNKSSGTGSLQYEWDFGDGQRSTQPNPVHTYTTVGTYSVKLVARNGTGCADSLLKANLINIGTVKAAFAAPALVCSNTPVNFSNNASPAPVSSYWSFGDGSFSTDPNPVKTYSKAGSYQVKLVTDFGACKDSVTQPVRVIAAAKATFTINDSTACSAPFTAQLTAQTTDAVNYQWLFGDGRRDSGKIVSHTWNDVGEYDVTLIVTNAAGCTDTLVKKGLLKIQPPKVTITNLAQEGCVPFEWKPKLDINTVDSVISFLWYFGDGITSTEKYPRHTYTTAGTYHIKLEYTTASGCKNSVVVNETVRVGNKPIVAFSATPLNSCAGELVSFKDESSGPKADRWLWKFGDGSSSSEQHPSHTYLDTGYLHVQLFVWNNGCMDSLTRKNYVYIKPPVARFDIASIDCGNRLSRQFFDKSVAATAWFWEFGDGQTSTARNPRHTFSRPGTYLVKLTVKNATCEHWKWESVTVVDEKADLRISETELCKNVSTTIAAINSNEANIALYSWTITKGNKVYGTPVGKTFQFAFPDAGQYDIRLIIKDIYGCSDTMVTRLAVRVNGPTADFSVLNPEVCTNSTVHFADSSVPDGLHAIQKWQWDYGDGATEMLNAAPFQHTYTQSGSYTVKLTVTDNLGCADTRIRQHAVIISRPVTQFESPDTLSCTAGLVRFVNQTTGNSPVYTWYFGDGQRTAALEPAHTYTKEGTYTVKLVAVDLYGCSDSMTREQYIQVRDPRAGFAMSDSFATCPPLLVNFTNQSQQFTQVLWDFGDGNYSVLTNPSHIYTYPGVYRAKLIITSPGGCHDSLVRIITVKGPTGSFTYDKLKGCVPTTIHFNALSNQSVRYIWDYSDGVVDDRGNKNMSHVYTSVGAYLPKMILEDPQGCRVPVLGKDTIYIYGVDARFTTNSNLLCDSGLVRFTNTSSSNDLITSYRWVMGDGVTSTEKDPVHRYRKTGMIVPRLTVYTQAGCMDTASMAQPLRIAASPLAAIQGMPGSCVPARISFEGRQMRTDTASLRWQWDFGNGQEAGVQRPDTVIYPVAGDYQTRLIITNSAGCSDTAFQTVHAWPIPVVNAGNDLSICRDTKVQLTATGADHYQWFPATALSCIGCATPLASPLEDTRYTLTGRNKYGCSAADSIRISVKQPFKMVVGKGDTLCKGESFRLSASGADEYYWSPSRFMEHNTNSNPEVKPDSTVTFRVIGKDSLQCFSDTGYVSVVVYPYPAANAGEDKTVPVGSQVTLKALVSQDVTSMKWHPSAGLNCVTCATPVATPKQTTTYTLETRNGGGCMTRDQVTVFVFCNNANVFVPNTFSPNGDGNNDVFYPRGKGVFRIQSFKVFNRWGELVFDQTDMQANDLSRGWTGLHKGKPASPDVYVYVMDVVCENNVVLNYKGNVALIR